MAARARGGAADPRAFTWLPDYRTALTVISRSGTAELALLRIEGDRLRKDVLDLDVPAEQVRTTPLPDGRVAVSWADGSRFVDLG